MKNTRPFITITSGEQTNQLMPFNPALLTQQYRLQEPHLNSKSIHSQQPTWNDKKLNKAKNLGPSQRPAKN